MSSFCRPEKECQTLGRQEQEEALSGQPVTGPGHRITIYLKKCFLAQILTKRMRMLLID
jgi:hypothetical protein